MRKYLAFALATNMTCGIAAAETKTDPIVDFVYEARLAYGLCSQESRKSILDAEYNSVVNRQAAVYDFTSSTQCRKVQGSVASKKLSAIPKSALKNRTVADELKGFQAFWTESMLSSLIPGGLDTKSSFERKTRDTNLKLKELGNRVVTAICKSDFSCLEEKSEKLREFDQLI